MTFGALLRSHRLARGTTMRQLARTGGVNVGTICRLEKGHRRPTGAAQVLALTGALCLDRAATDVLLHAAGYPCSRCGCRLSDRMAALDRYHRWARSG